MRRTLTFLTIVLVCLMTMGMLSAEDEPTAQEKKDLAVKLAKLLEVEPFHKDAK